ncbi:hypothetical protein GF314_06185 [bacterium]|nr:hypothetical protein [bacterium]
MTDRRDQDETPDRTPPEDRDRAREVDRAIEQEARRRRSDLAGLLAGRDGGDHLRGASPTPVIRRALLEIEQWLQDHLDATDPALVRVLLRWLAARPERLEAGVGRPAATLADWLPRLLDSPAVMRDLVREIDMAWGELNQERPHFERPGEPPHPDDPYTLASVTRTLETLRDRARGQG